MPIVPIALNIFGFDGHAGDNLWLSHRTDGEWFTKKKMFSIAALGSGGDRQPPNNFGAGATVASQANRLGTVFGGYTNLGSFNPYGAIGPRFAGNGSPNPVFAIPFDIALEGVYQPQPGIYNHVCGARFVNGAYWYISGAKFNSGDDMKIVCSRSGDDGATWTQQDNGNAPLLWDATTPTGGKGILNEHYWDEAAGNLIYVFLARPDPANAAAPGGEVWSFDTSANGGLGTWNQETDAFADVTAFRGFFYARPSGYLVRHPDGDLGVVYNKGTFQASPTPLGDIVHRVWNGSAWSGETVVRATSTRKSAPGALSYDASTELSYLFIYYDYDPGIPVSSPGFEKAVLTVAHDGTPSADLQAFPAAVIGSDGFGTGLIHDGIMMVPYDFTEDGFNSVYEWTMSGALNFVKVALPVPAEEEGNLPSCAALYLANVDLETGDVGEGSNGNGGAQCVPITAPAITPAIEWKDEALEQ